MSAQNTSSKTSDPDGFKSFMERGRATCGGLFERPFVSWHDDVALFMGRLASYSAVYVEDRPRSRSARTD